MMAGDWIKLRASLSTDPKIKALGDAWYSTQHFSRDVTDGAYDECYVSRNALRYMVTGALHNVWCNVNEHGENGVVSNATLEWINDLVGIGDFASAMASVGWVVQDGCNLVFPKFGKLNTCGADRQKRYRDRKKQNDVTRDVTRDVTHDVTRDTKRREEKNREEENNTKDKEKLHKEKVNTRQLFAPPTIDEVQAYCDERDNGIDAEAFVACYAAQGWKLANGNPVKDWKACVITWEKRSEKEAAKARGASRCPTPEDLANWNPTDGGLGYAS